MSFEKELQRARQRLVSQSTALKEAESALAVAVARGMLASQAALTSKITRMRDAVGKTGAMIKEIEEVLGAPVQADLANGSPVKPAGRR